VRISALLQNAAVSASVLQSSCLATPGNRLILLSLNLSLQAYPMQIGYLNALAPIDSLGEEKEQP
jgi:hypothetical protein